MRVRRLDGGGSPAARAASTMRPRAQASAPSSSEPQVRAQVGLAEADRRDLRARPTRSRTPRSTPSADSISRCSVAARAARRRARGPRRPPRPWGRAPPTASGSPATAATSSSCQGVPRVVDADLDPAPRSPGEQRASGLAARSLLPRGGDRVLEVDDHDVGGRRERLRDPVGPVGGHVEQGQRRACSSRSPRLLAQRGDPRRVEARARPGPGPCPPRAAGPVNRIYAVVVGEPEQRALHAASARARGPRSRGCVPSASNCGSAHDVVRVVDGRDRGLRPPRTRRPPRPASAPRSSRPPRRRARRRAATRVGPAREPRLVDEVGPPDEAQDPLGDRLRRASRPRPSEPSAVR